MTFAVLMAGDCIEGPTGPGSQQPARVRVEVILPPGTPDAWLPAGDTLRVLVRRAGRVEPIVDTAGATDSLRATVMVPLDQAIERFVATAELVYRGQVMFLAFDAVQLRAALDTTVVLTAVYVGPGGKAALLTVAAADSALEAGDTTTVVPTALDSAGQSLGRVPARFLADRPDLFTVDQDGHVTALDGAPDTARVDVVMPTGLTASLPLWLIEVLQPVTGQVVALISTRDGNREVYAMLEDGSGAVRLTESPEDEFFPAWSADGSGIAFERDLGGTRQIFAVRLADRTVTQLTAQGANTGPRFSPDGSKIGFTSTRNGGPEAWVMDADGGNQRRLVDPAGELDAFADWSPDGREILYVRRATPGSGSVVWAADTSGSGGRILLEAGEGWIPNVLAARWGPRGGLVAYTHADADTIIVVRGLDQSGGPDVGAAGSAFDAHAAFAREDDRFVFESDAGGAHAIYSQDAAGTVSRLSPPGIAEFEPDVVPPRPAIYVDRVVVSPDSVGLTSDESSQIWTASAVDATGRPVAAPVQWIPPSGSIAQLLTGPPVEIVALAVGKTWAIASYRGWRTDSAPVTITPATGPNAQRLVFRIGSDIYTMRGDGTDTVRLTTPAIGGYEPAFSPDGARIAWANRAGGDGDLWVMNADGSAPTGVTSGPADDTQPSWSPDGQQVVFSANRAGATPNQRQIWIVRLDGTGLRQLTFPPAANLQDADPAWSPDGSAVVFSRFVLGVGTSSLRAVDVSGGTDRALAMPAGSYRFPSWTPDGTALVYTRLNVGAFIQYLGVGRLPYPTGTETVISTGTTPRGFGSGGHLVPSVASDGLIAFSSGLGVTVMRADGTALSGLVPGGVPGNWQLATPPRYVAALTIGGDVATPLATAGTRQLSASATDQGGLPIVPVGGFRWTALDPAVATVDSTGLVTGEAAGSARIVAASGLAVPDTVTLTVDALVVPIARTWAGGDAAGPTDWWVAGNWSPAGVPAAWDTAVIVSAASQPVLTASATVARLRIAGGTLTLSGRTLTVTGDFSTENGLGTITMRQPGDTLVVGGTAVFQGGSTFGLLTDGALLVAGAFEQRTFVDVEPFRASGNHHTVLTGSGLQPLLIQDPTTTFHHLEIANGGGIDIPPVGEGVQFAVGGTLRVSTPVAVNGPFALVDVADSIVTAPGSAVTLDHLTLRGGIAVAGALDVFSVEFAGTDQTIPAQGVFQSVTVSGGARLAAPMTVGAVAVRGAQANLTLNGHRLDVGVFTTGELSNATGTLTMNSPADSLVASAEVGFSGGSTAGLLTAGTLIARSWFTQAGNPLAFQPSGSHRTVLSGASPQNVSFAHPGAPGAGSHFHHLELARTAGSAQFTTAAVVTGVLRADPAVPQAVTGPGALLGVDGVDVAGLTLDGIALSIGAGAIARFDDVTFANQNPGATQLAIARAGGAFAFSGLRFLTTPSTGLYVSATDQAPADGDVLTVTLAGAQPGDGTAHTATAGGAVVNWPGTQGVAATWVGGDPAGPTDWHVAGNWTTGAVPGVIDTAIIDSVANQPVLTASTTVAQLRILGGNLTLNGRALTVTGDFSTENGLGTITMQQPGDTLVVGGNALFQGGPMFGLLTDGVLLVAGDFGQLNAGSNWDTFRADDANHRTVLNGSAVQRLGIQGNLAFAHLEIANTGGGVEPVFGTVIDVQGDFRITTPTVWFAPDHGLDVEGAVSTVAGSELVAAQMRVGGALTVAGTFDVGITEFSGFDQRIPDLPYQEVVVSDSAYLGASVTMAGLFITGSSSGTSLTVNGHTLSVTEITTGGGGADPAVLIMRDPADTVIVAGNATFGGGNTEGLLTEGVLYLAGHFFHQQPGAFRATGNHRTVLNGAALQQLWMDQSNGLFNHLEVRNGGGGVEIPLVGEGALLDIGGTLAIPVPVPFIGEDATVSVGDSLVTVAGSEITLWGLVLRGGLSVAGGLSARQVEFAGADQTIPAQGFFTDVTVGGTARLAASMTFPGFVGVRGDQADLVLGGHRLDVGTLSVGGIGFPSGTVTMTNPADSLVVATDASFAGASSAGRLTAGTLIVGGGFFQGENPAAFQPSGTHRTVLTGAGAVRFDHPGVAGSTSWFHDLVIAGGASPLFQLSAGVTGTLELIGAMTVQTAAVTVDVVGNLLLRAGSTLNNGGTVQYGTFTNEGATINGNAPVQRP